MSAADAAQVLLAARREGPIEALPVGLRPASVAEAYAIQDASIEAILRHYGGGTRVGYKCGATNETAQANMGLEEPFRALLLSPVVHSSPASLKADDFSIRVIECEVAFRMGDDLPAAAAPYDLDAVRAAVAAAMPAIEIVDSRYRDWTSAGGLQIIADQGAAGHWVYGGECALEGLDLDDLPVSVRVNGEPKGEGNSGNVLGSPLNSLAWLANSLAAAGSGLKVGDLVTAGSCTAPFPASKGDEVIAEFGPLGSASVRFG